MYAWLQVTCLKDVEHVGACGREAIRVTIAHGPGAFIPPWGIKIQCSHRAAFTIGTNTYGPLSLRELGPRKGKAAAGMGEAQGGPSLELLAEDLRTEG